MRSVKIHGALGDSILLVGEKLSNIDKYINGENIVIITDTQMWHYYKDDFPACDVIKIGSGEKVKTLDTVREIYSQLMDLEIQRSSFIVGIGGGVVCDITGFVASTYLRGLRFGFVASTLLSQVDASVGGKNGVNFNGYKNMVGVFNQPQFVICDLNLLKTLPERELLNGFAEIVKHAVIKDPNLFGYLERKYLKALALDTGVLEKLVYDSVVIKAFIVNTDEKEKGERRKLNFGHTFGHAIEKVAGVSHGEAVSAGMAAASLLSVNRGLLAASNMERIECLLKKLKLPVRIPVDGKRVIDALKKDKKREGKSIHFVLLKDIGNAIVEKISIKELKKITGNHLLRLSR